MIHKEIERYHLVKQIRQRYSLLVKDNLGFPSPPKESLNRYFMDEISHATLKDIKSGNTLPPFPRSNFKAIVREITEDLPAKLKPPIQYIKSDEVCRRYTKEYIQAYNKMMGEDLKFEPTSDCMSYLLRLKEECNPKLVKKTKPLIRNIINGLKEILIESHERLESFDVSSFKEDPEIRVVVVGKFELSLTHIQTGFSLKLQKKSFNKLISINPSLSHCFITALRYQTLNDSAENIFEGTGQHAAIPKRVFDTLVGYYKGETLTEGFASPFNNYLSSFFSAFPDIDHVYGSKGSLFASYKTITTSGGVYEFNPPFSEVLIGELNKFFIRCLEKGEVPLTFIVILPWWQDSEPINNILRNDYTTGSLVLKAGEHYYISGSQHLNGEKEFNAVHDTIVIWLQNPPGIKKWPVEKKSFKI